MTFIHIPPPVHLVDLPTKDVGGKRFYITPNGNEYPSVTTILGQKENIQLQNWKAALGKTKADKEVERCTTRGTIVHGLIEHYLNNVGSNKPSCDLQYQKLFNQLKPWLNHIDNIRAQEVALYSDVLKVAGRVDCVGEYDGRLAIIDFKTSNNVKTKNMISDYFLQCTAYAIMWHELTQTPIETIVVMIAVERGFAPLVFVETIDKYVSQLLKRIGEFYNTYGNTQ